MENKDRLIFAEDAVFSSPSAASNMILGRNSNGFTEWINKKDPVSFETLLDIGLLWHKYCYEKNYVMQFESLKETIAVEVKRKDNEEDYYD